MTPAQIWMWNCIAFDLRHIAARRRMDRLGREVLLLVAQYGGAEMAAVVRSRYGSGHETVGK